MEKKNIAIIVLAVALVASGIGNIILGIQTFQAPEYTTLRFGTGSGPHDLDPVNSWDSASNDVIEQVAEGLFSYDYSNLSLPRIYKLAVDHKWMDNTTLSLKLREGVLFHDGTQFDAEAVKWNLERLNFLINATGELPATVPKAQTESLWLLPSGDPIIDTVEVVSTYNVTINLNGVFAPFLDLLCYANAYMLSPASTPAEDYIDISGDLVGTGPFMYDSYQTDVEVRFTRWDQYWQEPANFEKLVFVVIPDTTTRSNAMLNGEIDYIAGASTSLYATFEADEDIEFVRFTEETGRTSLVYQYLGVNNVKINKTYRVAMAYATNYTYMIEELLDGRAVKSYSPISPGWGSRYYNSSVNYPNYDLAQARQTLKDAGVAPSGWAATNDTEPGTTADDWLAAANGTGTPLGTFNYTGNSDNEFRADMYELLSDNYAQIGINLVNDLVTWGEYLDILLTPARYNELELYFIGWAPDYLNPWNMLDPLFNPASASNSAQVNDSVLTQALTDIVTELNETKRNDLIKWVQYYMAENQFHIYGYHSKITSIHSASLKGVAYNAMGTWVAYPIYRAEHF